MSSINVQPRDIKRMLGVKTDEEYDLIIKSYRFLFDLLCYATEGSMIDTGMVSWMKSSDTDILATDNGGKFSHFVVNPELNSDIIYQELADAVSKSSEIILPV